MQKVEGLINKPDNISLAHSFQEACSNSDFKAYVYNLGIKEETLMKYTSRLEEAFEECQNCTKCKSLENCPNKVPGYGRKVTDIINIYKKRTSQANLKNQLITHFYKVIIQKANSMQQVTKQDQRNDRQHRIGCGSKNM